MSTKTLERQDVALAPPKRWRNWYEALNKGGCICETCGKSIFFGKGERSCVFVRIHACR